MKHKKNISRGKKTRKDHAMPCHALLPEDRAVLDAASSRHVERHGLPLDNYRQS
ncbi:hypothetical protein [Ferrovibrio sp.]|uniref:hypothetical protein n=1 Tax=Ferrovibrio sp. TaxID=1917215 RepID=UPI00260E2FF7|nr:hypothetical protein [Ferrovibrio sp.]